MASILVGIFENASDAQATSKELVLAGVDSQSIRLSGRELGTNTADTERDRSDDDDKPGAISRFFADIFGMNDDNATYTDAVERGNVVLTVKLSDAQRVDELSTILENGGALEVDERAEPWQTDDDERSIGQRTSETIEDMPYGGQPRESDASRASQRYGGAERRYNIGAGYMGIERRTQV